MRGAPWGRWLVASDDLRIMGEETETGKDQPSRGKPLERRGVGVMIKIDSLGRTRIIKSNDERFWVKVNVCGFEICWEWLSHKSCDGYGIFDKRLEDGSFTSVVASRFAYESINGKIPYPLQVDHLCRNRSCCNPHHMEAVTQQENIRRGEVHLVPGRIAASRFRCKQGHLYDEGNTYIRPSGGRECRECRRIGLRKLYQQKREAQWNLQEDTV